MDTASASPARPRTVHHPLPSGPQAAGEARRSAARTLALQPVRCPQETACDILLIASELVTNAVRHALPPYALTISLDRGRAGICVSDGSLSPPRRGEGHGTDATHPGTTYQLWLDHDGTMGPAGFIHQDGTVLIDGDTADAAALGLTLEPAGGSPRPTTAPLLLMDLPV
ncbi:anti-sigma factor domain-containing protein [Streptomyces sp. NPDC054840]